ncbi:glycine betaine ABC transporter substrate-binding protein [Garicola koreensis]|uniref:Glycine betaine/proline transport system substrate-binding protein n=1 Tax=Garicola koreensis TaxID=1262554 RepID=A0A7W5TWK2_9MICC|nr:glycine betaine ABC transporter substrate-binding protein [Garicola koreensis]MBB3667969.1 glycine betaine/proline transport system substrate-binding protein [Garicola koreensis]
MTTSSKFVKSTAILSVLGLALTACGNGDGNGDDTEETDGAGTEETDTAEGNGDGGDAEAGGEGGSITLGIIPGWTDGVSMGNVWQQLLENQGYDVELQEVADAGALYLGVANGDVDVYPSAWPEVTHANYMEEHGDSLETLGDYYEGAVLTLAVPEYTDINSIDELNDNAEQFDNRVVGIEPGAGHMDITANEVFPTYNLGDNFELVESSTASMLTELDNAYQEEEDIVVTLWRPFWAYGSWDMKDLEDPEGALGEEEPLSFVANSEFSSEFPDAAEWMSNFSLSDDEYNALEDMIVNEYEGNEAEGAQTWLDENSDMIDEITG